MGDRRVVSFSASPALHERVAAFLFGEGRERGGRIDIGADGVHVENEHAERFYAWREVKQARADRGEVALQLHGGYAFRVALGDEATALAAVVRIKEERALARRRAPRTRHEPADVPQPGHEVRWLARQRARAAGDYRSSQHSPEDLAAELVDPDAPLHQRLGAAIVLTLSDHARARRALDEARALTANPHLAAALEALLAGTATDAALVAWLAAATPRSREIPPIEAAER
jgi:hypothetical protein